MNKQKNSKSQQDMSKSPSGAMDNKEQQQQQVRNPKQQGSKSEYGTTVKEDVSRDYE